MSNVEKIFPTEEELSHVSSQVQCSAENCFAIFKSTSNLNMHLIRHHKVRSKELCRKDAIRQFYCPVKLCIYNEDSGKCFNKLKYLKQHFLKVHAVKNFVCSKCNKKFATDAFKKLHLKTCGSLFSCSCGFAYNSMEALLTHCRRKGHTSLCSKSRSGKVAVQKETVEKGDPTPKKPERLICPKFSPDISYPVDHIAAVALSELSVPYITPKVTDKSIQTECCKPTLWKDFKKNFIPIKSQRKNNSQQTETSGKLKNLKKNIETQTNTEFLKNKFKTPSKTCSKKRKKSMETQTKDMLNTVMFNSSMNIFKCEEICKSSCKISNIATNISDSKTGMENIFPHASSDFLKNENSENSRYYCTELTDFNSPGRKSFITGEELSNNRTKTCTRQDLFSSAIELNICSKEFETAFSELNACSKKVINENENFYSMESGSYNVFDINRLCNIETQTEMDNFLTECNDDSTFTLCSTTETQTIDYDPLLYSNMCTQTPDEVNELFNFNFVDIETQTAWPDF